MACLRDRSDEPLSFPTKADRLLRLGHSVKPRLAILDNPVGRRGQNNFKKIRPPYLLELRVFIGTKRINEPIQSLTFRARKQFCWTKVDQRGQPVGSETFQQAPVPG